MRSRGGGEVTTFFIQNKAVIHAKQRNDGFVIYIMDDEDEAEVA
ncbi:hypothetical protein [Paenibacillus taiwanensis]|nr:hypothetical protein [Paenibacillus taiwanensis]